jgi:hypothetical protein
LKFVRLKVREGKLSQTGMISIIMMRKMETDRLVISRLEKLVEKEVDREKKRIVEEHRQLLQRFDHKCEVCGIQLKEEDRAIRIMIKSSEGLLCQDCFRYYPPSGSSQILKRIAKYIDLKNGKS